MSHELHAFLAANGYTDLREVPGRGLCGLCPMAYTHGLFVELTLRDYSYRYCFENAADARAALEQWDGVGDAPGLWIKRKGFGADLMNPNWSSA